MSAIYEAMGPGGHETYATSIFSKIKTYLDSNPYTPVKDVPNTPTAIASFNDGSDLPMPSLKVAIEPQQEGSGDPSPTNVRPINGWDEANVGVVGKNLCKSTIQGYVSSTDNLIIIDNDTESAIFYAFEGKTYTISSSATMNKSRLALVGTDIVENYTPILQREILADNVNTWTATWTGWTVWYKCGNRQTAFDTSAQVELGSTPTTYEPYNGSTYTIDLDGTRYGGELDVVSGVLTVDRAYVDMGDLNWTYANGFFRTLDLNSTIKRPANNYVIVNAISSIYKAESWNAISRTSNDKFAVSIGTSDPLIVCNTDYTDATSFKQAMSGVQLVYELATPQTIQLTPTQVKSLLGVNNIWADTGDVISGEYIKQDYDGMTAKYATYSGSATIASKLGTSNVGSATKPMYLNVGVPTECTYSLNKTVPSDAVFTDTKVTQTATDGSSNAEYEVLFSGTADDTTRTEGTRKTSLFTFNPQTNEVAAGHFAAKSDSPSGIKTASLVGYDIQLGGTSNTWDGTNTSLKSSITSLRNDKVNRAGDTIYGDLSFAGSDVRLQTSGSSTDNSGDIVFYYGNGNEKSRIWTNNEYTASMGPNYRVYKKDGTALYNGRLATLGDLSWGNISGKPSTFPPSSHSHDYLPTAGGTMTGIAYSSYGSASWVNSLTKSAITLNDTIGFGGWICGPTKNGRIAIATYKNGDDVLYIGYGERGRTQNSYTRRMFWNGANGMLASTVVYGELMLRSSYIGRNDSGDSGYINHVNTGNTAYAPTRASAFTTMSCKYTKTNVVDISEEDALKLLDIRPVNFDYVEEVGGQKNQIGVLAEDTYEILPKVVSVPDDYIEEDFDISKGIHQPLPSVDYAKFVPYLIKLVQMQQKEIDILKKERT